MDTQTLATFLFSFMLLGAIVVLLIAVRRQVMWPCRYCSQRVTPLNELPEDRADIIKRWYANEWENPDLTHMQVGCCDHCHHVFDSRIYEDMHDQLGISSSRFPMDICPRCCGCVPKLEQQQESQCLHCKATLSWVQADALYFLRVEAYDQNGAAH